MSLVTMENNPLRGLFGVSSPRPEPQLATPQLKEICPRGNNKVVIYISLYHDK